MNTKTQTTTDRDKPSRPNAFWYHLAIFLGAAGVLLAGGIWRGGSHPDTPQESVSALEMLRQEVSGLQSVLRRNELQSIQDGMAEVTRTAARSIVAIKPAGDFEPARTIRRYGLVSGGAEPGETLSVSPGMSGLIVDQEGHIVTSANVSDFGKEFQVIVDGAEYTAELKAVDALLHIALLKLTDGPSLPSVRFDDAAAFKAGEWLIRQGRSPSGMETRSAAMLEALRITDSGHIIGLVDGEAAPELDGATLLDIAGRIVGIQVLPPQGAALALPISDVLKATDHMKSVISPAPRSWAGFEIQELSADLQEYFMLDNGALVTKVIPGSPAAEADLRPRDIVLKLHQQEVTSPKALMDTILGSEAGTAHEIMVKRGTIERTLTLTTVAPPVDSPILLTVRPAAGGGVQIDSIAPPDFGRRSGLRTGDVVLAIDNVRLRNSAQMMTIQRRMVDGKSLLWEIERDGDTFFIAVKERVTVND